MKFSIKNFFSKCAQIHKKLRIWSHLLKKSLKENFIFCAVAPLIFPLFNPYTRFFLSNTFISNNARVKLAKNKQKLSNTTMRLNFRYLKIIRFPYPRYYPKLNEDILKNVQKTSSPVLMTLYLV